MNPVHLFMLTFLAVCFFLVLIQRNLTFWQRLSLLVNPALLAACILIFFSKTADDRRCAADLYPVAEQLVPLLASGENQPERSAAAAAIRKFITENGSWQELSSALKNIREKQ